MAPPRFVHYDPCYLRLCPLRDDLVPSKQTKRQLSGQLDGQGMSSGNRETPIEVVSSDEESKNDTDADASKVEDKQDRDDLDSLPDYEDLDSVPDSVVIRNTTYLSGENDRSRIIAPESPRVVPPFFDDDVFELLLNPIFSNGGSTSTYTSTYTSAVEDQEDMTPAFEPGSRPLTGPHPECSDSDCDTLVEEEVKAIQKTLLTPEPLNINTATATAPTTPSYDTMDFVDLSEFATPAYPSDMDDDDEPVLSLSHAGTLLGKRSRTTSPNEESNNKRLRREEPPELDEFISQVNSLDYRPANDLLPTPYTLKPPPPFQIPGKALRITTEREITPGDGDTSPSSLPSPYTPTPIPTGPRALGGGALVCFYWYHTGHCKPNRRNGRTMSCNYAHHLDNTCSRVSRPPHARSHDPDCQLPLCPIRLRQTNRHINSNAGEQRKPANQQRRPKKEDQRAMSMLPLKYDDEDNVSRAATPNTIATLTKRGRKQKGRAMTGRRVRELYNPDLANSGRIEKYDKEAQLYSDEYQPLDGFPDSDPENDPRDETERVRESREKALNMVEALNMKTQKKKRSLRPLMADQTVGGRVSKEADKRAAKTKVDYKLPGGGARLEWDTDLVRRLFGEIE
jgi:hypothetical protein